MAQIRRYPQRACRKPCLVVSVAEIVFYKPVRVGIRHDIYSRVGEVGYRRKRYGRTVGLHSVLEHFLHVFHEESDRDLLVCTVVSHVYSRERDESHFRVCHETTPDGLHIVLVRSQCKQHSIQIEIDHPSTLSDNFMPLRFLLPAQQRPVLRQPPALQLRQAVLQRRHS